MAKFLRNFPKKGVSGASSLWSDSKVQANVLLDNEFFDASAGGTTPLKDFLSDTIFQSGVSLGSTNSEYSVGGTPLKNVLSTTLV